MRPFFKFKLGYIDGFKGNPVRCPSDKDYIFGYESGVDDDFMGKPNKFSESKEMAKITSENKNAFRRKN